MTSLDFNPQKGFGEMSQQSPFLFKEIVSDDLPFPTVFENEHPAYSWLEPNSSEVGSSPDLFPPNQPPLKQVQDVVAEQKLPFDQPEVFLQDVFVLRPPPALCRSQAMRRLLHEIDEESHHWVDYYVPDEPRKTKLRRYLLKKKSRVFKKKISYPARKEAAEVRPRVGGKFAPKLETKEEIYTWLEAKEKDASKRLKAVSSWQIRKDRLSKKIDTSKQARYAKEESRQAQQGSIKVYLSSDSSSHWGDE